MVNININSHENEKLFIIALEKRDRQTDKIMISRGNENIDGVAKIASAFSWNVN